MKIDLTNYSYGPNTFPIRQGGTLYYRFDVNFQAANPGDPPPTPPSEFTYTVRMKNADGQVVKTVTGTVPTHGQSVVSVRTNVEPTRDVGGALAFGNYSNHFEVAAFGYPTYDQRVCTGRTIVPEDCDCEASCKV